MNAHYLPKSEDDEKEGGKRWKTSPNWLSIDTNQFAEEKSCRYSDYSPVLLDSWWRFATIDSCGFVISYFGWLISLFIPVSAFNAF